MRDKASHICMGGASPLARSANTRARFSPACFRPVKNMTIRCPCRVVDTMPVVNSPVRSWALDDSSFTSGREGLARASAKIFMLVSSL